MSKVDHSRFTYKKGDIEPSGAIKGCVCDDCSLQRGNYKADEAAKELPKSDAAAVTPVLENESQKSLTLGDWREIRRCCIEVEIHPAILKRIDNEIKLKSATSFVSEKKLKN